jgi:2-oxoglutarate ferredoxin oxidoreductase subunit delta
MALIIDSIYCKGCNLCVTICSKAALVPGSDRNQKGYVIPRGFIDKCVFCKNCEKVCPEMAISVTKEA